MDLRPLGQPGNRGDPLWIGPRAEVTGELRGDPAETRFLANQNLRRYRKIGNWLAVQVDERNAQLRRRLEAEVERVLIRRQIAIAETPARGERQELRRVLVL